MKADASTRRARFWVIVRGLFGLGGLGLVIFLVRDQGVDELAAVIEPALPWLPLALVLQAVPIATDALSSRFTLGRRGADVPWLPLFGAHFVAFAVMGVTPAGRATAEAVKASLLARWIGAPTAAALGTANQANVLISSGTFTIASAVAAYVVTGPSVLTALIVAHVVIMNASGLALRAAARYERFGAWLARRFPKVSASAETFQDASRETALVPAKPVVVMIFGRAFQAGHFGILAHAVGLDPGVLGALTVHGVYLVVAALAVLIPGQIGASEWAFSAAAGSLDTTVARAMSIALLSHAVQLVLVGVGFCVLILWPSRPER